MNTENNWLANLANLARNQNSLVVVARLAKQRVTSGFHQNVGEGNKSLNGPRSRCLYRIYWSDLPLCIWDKLLLIRHRCHSKYCPPLFCPRRYCPPGLFSLVNYVPPFEKNVPLIHTVSSLIPSVRKKRVCACVWCGSHATCRKW